MFGNRLMPAVYGAVLTAWSAAGIVGPQIIAAIKDRAPESAAAWSFAVSTGILAAGLLASLTLRDRTADIG